MKTVISLCDHFWSRVDKSGECWLWTGSTRGQGYGQCTIGHKKQGYAHRFAYELTYGPIPAGKVIDHTCHVRLCCNPTHLRAVDHKQNMENLSGAYSNSKSGIRGVWWVARLNKWKATVAHNQKPIHIGWYLTKEAAAEAVTEARNSVFTHNDLDRKNGTQ